MSGRGENGRTIFRGVLVIVVIAAALGVFGSRSSFKRPELSALNIVGIAVMFLGLAMAMLAAPLSERLARKNPQRASLAFRLGGVAVCCAGAAMVFM